jgi:formylglycine-generating enzyme required for sulfatase activity
VGSFPANGFGLHDMIGNVWEWTQDCWNGSYRDAPTDGSAWISGNCERRVVRGGSWNYGAAGLRVSNRHGGGAAPRPEQTGFRLAQDAK